MRKPLQDFDDSNYQRPTQKWHCGLNEHCQPCPFGPDKRGRCPALAECNPVQESDRWVCNRAPNRGGPCDEGPAPDGTCCRVNHCRPQRSLRHRRGRFIVACTLFTLGVLLLLVTSKSNEKLINPGNLTHHHATILHGENGSKNCAACHNNDLGTPVSWAKALVFSADMHSQTALCMKCHEDMIPNAHALHAHTTSPSRLQAVTFPVQLASGTSELQPENQHVLETIACAVCHREHHGTEFDLTHLGNHKCQTCHQQTIESFASDHPNFGTWPYRRRTRIVFDHASHELQHFTKKKQTFDCRQCHVESPDGGVQLLASYQASCATCHDEPLQQSMTGGLAFLALPTIDQQAFADHKLSVGEWPEWATGDFDGPLPAVMKVLLAADEKAAKAMALLGVDFEFADVDPDDQQQCQAAADLVWAIKRLILDLEQHGEQAAQRRLNVVLDDPNQQTNSMPLLAQLAPETLESLVKQWLPNLKNELTGKTNSEKQPRNSNTETIKNFGRWVRNDQTFSLRYQTAGHADPWLTHWIDQLASQAKTNDKPTTELAAARQSVIQEAFHQLTRSKAPGQCATCHSIDELSNGQLALNWQPLNPNERSKGFTKFDHGPHLLQSQLKDCKSCHEIDIEAKTATSYLDHNPATFVSDFHPLTKAACANCHQPHIAGDNCMTCHRYHVDPLPAGQELSSNLLRDLAKQPRRGNR